MNNNRQYFVLTQQLNGSVHKEYPAKAFPFSYQGIDMFCYQKVSHWLVINKNIGIPMALPQYSRQAAMQSIRDYINLLGVNKVNEVIKEAEEAIKYLTIYEESEEN